MGRGTCEMSKPVVGWGSPVEVGVKGAGDVGSSLGTTVGAAAGITAGTTIGSGVGVEVGIDVGVMLGMYFEIEVGGNCGTMLGTTGEKATGVLEGMLNRNVGHDGGGNVGVIGHVGYIV